MVIIKIFLEGSFISYLLHYLVHLPHLISSNLAQKVLKTPSEALSVFGVVGRNAKMLKTRSCP